MGQQAGASSSARMLRTVALDTPRPIALDERLAADRRGGRDVFLDDGPKDRLRAEVQGAEGAADSSRQGRFSRCALALYR